MRQSLGKLRYLLTAREQRQALLLLTLMMIGAVLEMVGVGAIPAFVALLSQPDRVYRYALTRSLISHLPNQSTTSIILWAAGALLTISVIKNSYIAALAFTQSRYVTNRQVRIARRLFEAYLRSPYTFHLQRNTAQLLHNTNSEALNVVSTFMMPALTLSMEAFTAGAILLLLLIAEPLISLVAFLVLGGATFVFLRVIRQRLLRYAQQLQHYGGLMVQTINEGLGGIKIAKILTREDHFLRSFGVNADRFAEAGQFRQFMIELPRLFLETAAIAGVLGVAALLLARGEQVQAIIPTLSLLAVAVVRMIPSFNRITSSLTLLRYGKPALEVVYADLRELEPNALARPEHVTISFHENIQFEHIDYRYPNASRPSLQDISLEIAKGSVVGVVGPTGSGKTTLIDCLLGLLEPSRGRITVDGRDIRDATTAWQRHIGYVPQDIFLVDSTIRSNIAFGLPEDDINDEAVQRAVDAAQLRSFVDSLPTGLSTIVGERGVRLSGGQRQRIGIARALYHDPEVIIFDEATSSLDNETERYVMDAVDHLRGGRTIILIAHRLTTVRTCDVLFVLSEGRLVSSGSYKTLREHSTDFRRLLPVE